MAIKAIGIVGRTEIAKVDPRQIVVDEAINIRQEYGDIETLKKSIEQNGLMMPILVRKTKT